MAITGLKRSLFSNTSCFSNLYLVECLRKYKSKSYLNSLMMTIEKDLSLAKKKLDCLRMKMCKGVRLRGVKVKGLARKRQMRESTIPTDLSSKHEVCFMMKFAFKAEFEISMIEEITHFLEMQICQQDSGIFISQSKYAKNLVKKFGLESTSSVRTPMSPNVKLIVDLLGKSVDPSL